jgi:hypothetical protein
MKHDPQNAMLERYSVPSAIGKISLHELMPHSRNSTMIIFVDICEQGPILVIIGQQEQGVLREDVRAFLREFRL